MVGFRDWLRLGCLGSGCPGCVHEDSWPDRYCCQLTAALSGANLRLMNGAPLMDAGPAAVAAYVRRHAPAAGYDLDARGEQARLARDASMGTDALTRLLKGERLPKPAALWPLAEALRRPYLELLVESGTIPAESLAHMPEPPVASEPITADALADQWGVTDDAGREFVRDSLERLRALASQTPHGKQGGGRAANG